MAPRSIVPSRAATLRIRAAFTQTRSLGGASTAVRYPMASTTSKFATPASPTPASTASTTGPKSPFTPGKPLPWGTSASSHPSPAPAAPFNPPPDYQSASSPRFTAASPASSVGSAPLARSRVPAVSGQPLPDAPPAELPDTGDTINWRSSYHGLGTSAFSPEVSEVLTAAIDPYDVEIKPDGIIYLPEIKYRRVLNAAFGPGGWGLAPRNDLQVQDRLVSREYGLVVHGRLVGQARGEMQYFNEEGIATAAEGCKSNALMRCCKDLGIASDLWDPRFIRKFMKDHAQQIWVEHTATKKKKQIWLRKDDEVKYPFKRA